MAYTLVVNQIANPYTMHKEFRKSALSQLHLLAGVFGIFAAAVASAGALTISPMRLSIHPERQTTELRVSNGGEATAHVQFQLFTWSQDAEGDTTREPSKDLLFFPKILSIEPGNSRVVRFGWSQAWPEREKSYRFLIRELPVDTPGETAMRMVINLDMPVFVPPRKSQQAWRIDPPLMHPDGLHVPVINTGNVHVRLTNVEVQTVDDGGQTLVRETAGGWYVLAGSSFTFVVPLKRADCESASTLIVTAQTEKTEKRLSIEGAEKHCEEDKR